MATSEISVIIRHDESAQQFQWGHTITHSTFPGVLAPGMGPGEEAKWRVSVISDQLPNHISSGASHHLSH
jgi:hypothetical protein